MEVLRFIAKLADALAWPLVFLVLLVFLRPHFDRIIGLVKTVKYKGFEVTFGEMTPVARESLEQYWMPDGQHPNPRNAVALKAWMRINGLTGASITTLLNAAPLEAARRKAVEDLKLDQPSTGGDGG